MTFFRAKNIILYGEIHKLMPNEPLIISSFIHRLKAESREQILQSIAWKVGRETGADMTWLADQLLISESNETSGIGDGVAIPHLKSTPLKMPHIVIATLDQPVDFEALDGQPVDIVCAVFSPQMDGVIHLRRLSRMTRLLRESFLLGKLRNATSEDEMAALFATPNPQILAA